MELPNSELIHSRIRVASEAAKKLPRLLRVLEKHASEGAILTARATALAADRLANDLVAALSECRTELSASLTPYLESSEYRLALQQECKALDIELIDEGSHMYCFPTTVRIVADQETVMLDEQRHTDVNPRSVAGRLKAARTVIESGNSAETLELLSKVYAALTLRAEQSGGPTGGVVPLLDIYNVLTIWPERKRSYSRNAFALDLYMLDHRGATTTRLGATLTFTASTGAKDRTKVFKVKDHDGIDRVYSGIFFTGQTRD